LTVEAIANYAKAVWAAFPDVTFELVGVREIAPGQVAHEWLLRGTNTGPLMDGSAAAGRTVTLSGCVQRVTAPEPSRTILPLVRPLSMSARTHSRLAALMGACRSVAVERSVPASTNRATSLSRTSAPSFRLYFGPGEINCQIGF
jgi:hypothetical protein